MNKKLLSKEQLNEYFNPVLDGSVTNALQGIINTDAFDDFYDRPSNLEVDDTTSCNKFTSDKDYYADFGKLYLSATFINGKPLTSWSAKFMNQPGGINHDKKDNMAHMANMYHLYNLVKDKVSSFVKQGINTEFEDNLNITNINIIKIIKTDGINIDFILTFDLNEYKNIFCKFNKFNSNNVSFICSEIKDLSKEIQLRIKGKLFNILTNYLVADSGYYTLLSEEFYIFTALGEIKKIYKNSIIEVIKSTKDIINIRIEDKLYIIKKPDYYYFNWYFSKN